MEMQRRYTILLHGGTVLSGNRETDTQLMLLRSIVEASRRALADGAAAVDVVVDAIVTMEDSGLLNAGKGSVPTSTGLIETDASLMEGHSGRMGAVAAMRRLRNPIRAARIVMEKTPHVLLAGTGGEETLIELGAEVVDEPRVYFTRSRSPGPGAQAHEHGHGYGDGDEHEHEHESGTVGAVALDRHGNLAAGTSTGGYRGKLPGRVGDSAIVGASTYANERYALSTTGRGEAFIRRSATVDIARRAEFLGLSLQAATDHVVHRLLGEIDGADAAVIGISRDGEIVLAATHVFGALHAYASESTGPSVGVEIGGSR